MCLWEEHCDQLKKGRECLPIDEDICKGSQRPLQFTMRRLFSQEPGKVSVTTLFSIVLKTLDHRRGHDIEANCKQTWKGRSTTVCSQDTWLCKQKSWRNDGNQLSWHKSPATNKQTTGKAVRLKVRLKEVLSCAPTMSREGLKVKYILPLIFVSIKQITYNHMSYYICVQLHATIAYRQKFD